MPGRLPVVIVVLLAFAGQAAVATGAEVSVRVEGLTRTIFEGPVETVIHPVDGSDGSGFHTCSGPLGEAASPSLTGALDDAMRGAGLAWQGGWDPSAGDFLITSIGGEEATPAMPWSTLLNGEPTPTGGCTTEVRTGDRVLLAYDAIFRSVTLALSGPGEADSGEKFTVIATDERDEDTPVAGATVSGAGSTAVTGADGGAAFIVREPGRYEFKAEHPDAIRSNAVTVCVGLEPDECDSGQSPPAWSTRISKIDQGQRFMRGAGPRILRGRVSAAEQVVVAIKRRGVKGRKPGLAWKPARVEGGSWSKRLATLRPGRYRLFSRAIGTASKQTWISGVNRIDFTVRNERLNRRRLESRATEYLRRAARSGTVRDSRLLRGWTMVALGRTRSGAKLLTRGLLGNQLENGSFGGDLNRTAMAIVAISGSRPLAARRAADWIVSSRNTDGGFGFSEDAPSDSDTSGLAAWALALTGRWNAVRDAAVFVQSLQNADGGFPATAGGDSNAQSTGLGMIALRLAGRSLPGIRTEDGITPLHYLAGLQRKNGAINYTADLAVTPSWVTAQALLGTTSASSSP